MKERIEHTFLKPTAVKEDLRKLCEEAMTYQFGLVAVQPCWVAYCKEQLLGSDVLVDAAVGFPLGQNLTETKAAEAMHCILAGADEIDMVMNVGKLLEKDYDYVLHDIQKVVAVCHSANTVCKVILETSLLSTDEIVTASQLAERAGADYIKTSTGFNGGGATIEDITLMRQSVTHTRIKASAQIRSYAQAKALVDAGADRIGTSSGVRIMQEEYEANTH